MKKFILLIICISYIPLIFSQDQDYQIGDTIYYKKGIKNLKNDANYFSIIQDKKEIDDKTSFAMLGYKISDDSVILDARYSTFTLNNLTRFGRFVKLHKNGKKAFEGSFVKGKEIDKFTYWYENGQIREERIYYYNKSLTTKKIKEYDVINFWNKDGTQTLTNGNGYFELAYTSKKIKNTRKGSYKNGKKDGDFTGYKGSKKYFEEVYKNGKLINGTSWDKKGKKYNYKKSYVSPMYGKGQKSLAKYLKNNYVIPKYAIKNNIDGKIILKFSVSKEGRISNIKVVKGVCNSCDKEAVRVLKSMNGWKPGLSKGQKIKRNYYLPISYKID